MLRTRQLASLLAVLALAFTTACRTSDSHRPSVPRSAAPSADVERIDAAVSVTKLDTDAGSTQVSVTVWLNVDANGRTRAWLDGDTPEMLPLKIDASSFVTIAAAAKKRAATQVVITVDPRTTYSEVVGLIDALHAVGITQVAIQLAPSENPQNGVKP